MVTIKQSNLIREKAVGTFHIDHPMSVYTCMLDINNKDIINHFLQLKKQQQSALDNLSGWSSESNIHETQPIVLDLFKEVIQTYISKICPPRGNTNLSSMEVDANMWFSEYNAGDYADEHFHSVLPRISFVYYLESTDDSSPLTFCQKHWLDYGEYKTVREIDLEVTTGMLVLFPSILYHKVKPTKSKRYVIAGNIFDIYSG